MTPFLSGYGRGMNRLKSASLLALAFVAAFASHPGWAQRPDRIALQALPGAAVDREAWRTVANHVHTSESHDARAPLDELVADAKARGLDALVLTDHNSTAACAPEALDAWEERGLTVIPGEEWSSKRWGHAALLGYAGPAVLEKDGVEAALQAAERSEALAIANHPKHWGLSWQPGFEDARLSGVEVWNGFWGNPLAQNEAALAQWDAALRQGRRLVALGGADYHGYFYARIDQAVNRVQVAESGRDGIMVGLRDGRVQVAAHPGAAWVDLSVDGQGMGDVVPAPGTHRIRIGVEGGKGLELRVMTRDGVLARKRLDSNRVTFEGIYVASGTEPDFVRAEVRDVGAPLGTLQVLTNPVYLGAPTQVARKPER